MSTPYKTLVLLSTFAFFAVPAQADVLYLTSGGIVRGELLNPQEAPRASFDVRTVDGVRVSLDKGQVKRIVRSADPEALYLEYLPLMPADAEGNWKMAEWCLKNGLLGQRNLHLEAVVKFAPEHEAARRALGYQRINGKWQKRAEYWQGRGYVRHGGDWKLAQEVALAEADAERESEEIAWRRKVKLWRTWIVKQRGKESEGVESFRAIKDRNAARPLLDLLKDKDEPVPLKLLYISVLTELSSPLATDVFVKMAVEDHDTRVRDACINGLEKFESAFAVDVLVKRLQDKENIYVNRAALALGRLQDERATLPLIDALTTEHKIVIPGSGGNIGASFNKNGGGGLSTGGGPKVIKRLAHNRQVLNALSAIHHGVNYQFDKERWHEWHEEVNTPQQLNLRRTE